MQRGLKDCFRSCNASLSCLVSHFGFFQRGDDVFIVGQRTASVACRYSAGYGVNTSLSLLYPIYPGKPLLIRNSLIGTKAVFSPFVMEQYP